ncbi:unnamed protein product [Ixodes persulcatus]
MPDICCCSLVTLLGLGKVRPMGESVEFSSRRSPVLGSKAGASTDQPLASAAAIEVLQKGGNAADAAVAAAAVLQVLQPYATGIGGDCFCIFYNASDKSVRSIDGSGKSPAQLTLELLRSKGFGEKHLPDDSSGLTATVPGAVKGWFDTVKIFGSKKVHMLRKISETFPVRLLCIYVFRSLFSTSTSCEMSSDSATSSSRSACRSGVSYGTNPNCFVLSKISLSKEERFAGTANEVEVPRPSSPAIAVQHASPSPTIRDTTLTTPFLSLEPSVSSDHVVTWSRSRPRDHVLAQLDQHGERWKISSGSSHPSYGKTSGEYYHLLIEALRLAFADGLSCLSSPGHNSLTSVINMTCKKHAEDRRALIDTKRAIDKVAASDLLAPPQFHTTFLTTVDEHGNACAFINSNFKGFGCTIVEEYGFAVHSRAMGFVGVDGHPNCVGPLKKPYHTLMPVMVTDSLSGDWMANIGCMGGYGQPQINLQVLLGMLELGLNPQEAVDRARVMIGPGYSLHPDDALFLEEGLPSGVAQELKKRGHRFLGTLKGAMRPKMGFAHVVTRGSWWNRSGGSPSYTEGRDTFLWFGSDPRSDGAAMAY